MIPGFGRDVRSSFEPRQIRQGTDPLSCEVVDAIKARRGEAEQGAGEQEEPFQRTCQDRWVSGENWGNHGFTCTYMVFFVRNEHVSWFLKGYLERHLKTNF